MKLLHVLITVPLLTLASCADSDRPKTAASENQVATAPAPPAEPQPIFVTDATGMTVYYFINDTPNKSHCNDECSSKYWFPVRPQPGLEGGNFKVITRADGTQQVAYQGRPLYTYYRDKNPGDIKGDGQRGRWFALRY